MAPERKKYANPFKAMMGTLNKMASGIDRAFERLFRTPSRAGVSYAERHDNILQRWYTGSGGADPNKADFEQLYETASDKRYQNGYAITVTGTTEERYPTKPEDEEITLSYRLARSVIDAALADRNNRNLVDVINAMRPGGSMETWVTIKQVTIIDKD